MSKNTFTEKDFDPDYFVYWVRSNKQKRRTNNSLKPIHRQRKKALVKPGIDRKQCIECKMYNFVCNIKCNFCGNKFK